MGDDQDLRIELAAECSTDPLAWVQVAYDWGVGELEGHKGPRTWQADILAVIRDHLSNPETRYTPLRIAVASGHGIGKSAFVGMVVNWAQSTCEDARAVITANTETQLRTKTSPEVGKWSRMSATKSWFDVQSTSIKSKDKGHTDSWRADFVPWSEHNTEAYAGLHNLGRRILIVFDESSAIADKVWEVAQGVTTDEGTEIIWLAFGNPTRNTGMFRECFRQYKHRWITRQIDSRTVEGTNKEELARMVEDHGEDSDIVKVRIRGLFPNASVMQYIGEDLVGPAYGKELPERMWHYAPKIITCDSAWEGDNELVIGMRQGLTYRQLRAIDKVDNDVTVAKIIADYEDEHQADAVFLDAGYGTGIYSAGKTMGRAWMLVWSASSSGDPSCLNKRAEMWRLGKDYLAQGGTIPADPVLRDELQAPNIIPRLDGKLQIESKKEMRIRKVPSPNRADAFMLSFAYPVTKRTTPIPKAGTSGDYDPLKYMQGAH